VRKHTELPVAVGFGISQPGQVEDVWKIADGAVVGSAIVAVMENADNPKIIPSKVSEFCRWLVGTQ
jgi:tryptophan synthase alpha chain